VAQSTTLHEFLHSYLQFRHTWYDLTHPDPRGTIAGLVVGELAASPSLSSPDAADGDGTLVVHASTAAPLSASLFARYLPASSLSPPLSPCRGATLGTLHWPHMVDTPGTDGPRERRGWEAAVSGAPVSSRFVILILSL